MLVAALTAAHASAPPPASSVSVSVDTGEATVLPDKVRTEGGAGVSATSAVFGACDAEVVVLRLPGCDTDVVFSLHGRVAAGGAEAPPLAELVATLEVVEWGLFGGEGEGGEEGGGGRLLGS